MPNKLYTGGATEREHKGVDFIGTWQARVVAVTDCTVVELWYVPDIYKGREGHPEFGGYLRLQDAEGNVYAYAHLAEIKVHYQQKVKAGEIIARMGNSGRSTGQHLHFSIQTADQSFVNPLRMVEWQN